jgi:hypothetical protein
VNGGWRARLHFFNAVVIGALGTVLAWRGIGLRSVPLLLMAAAFVGYAVFRVAAFRRTGT